MKRCVFYLLFVFAFLTNGLTNSFAQVEVKMKKVGGIYTIPCTVNGIELSFVFDTGASSVCISEDLAIQLIKNNTLSQSDVLRQVKSVVADGRTVECSEINLRSVEIGQIKLKDVRAVVVPGQSTPLLFGQSALEQFGHYTIINDKLILTSKKSWDEKVDEIQLNVKYLQKFNKYFDDEEYDKAISVLNEKKDRGLFDLADLKNMIRCYILLDRFYKAQDCFKVNSALINENDGDDCYNTILHYIYFNLGLGAADGSNNDLAISFYKKALQYYSTPNCYLCLANSYFEKSPVTSEHYFRKGINLYMAWHEICITDIVNGKVNDLPLATNLALFAMLLDINDDVKEKVNSLYFLASKCGDFEAIKVCKERKCTYSPNCGLFDKYNISKTSTISISGAVDLGLSVKWAAYNIGASKPEQKGTLCAWGDNTGTINVENEYDYPIKCEKNIYGGPEFDIVAKKMGNGWRLPNRNDFKELINNCKFIWTTYKGVKGFKIVGPNNNAIFMPVTEPYADLLSYWTGNNSIYNHSCSLSFFVGDSTFEDEEGEMFSYRKNYVRLGIRPVKSSF